MARRVRDSKLETRSARDRLKLAAYHHRSLVPGQLSLGYRRAKKGQPGTWSRRVYTGTDSNGIGHYVTTQLGLADDFEDADGERILNFGQAQLRAQGKPASAGTITVRQVVTAYIAERDARESRRQGRPKRSDAHRLEYHVIGRAKKGNRAAIAPSKLADVALSSLDEDLLQAWRAGKDRRTINDLKAALNGGYARYRKQLDPSLPGIIRHGLRSNGQEDDETPTNIRENQILSDAQVTKLLRATKEIDAEQGWDGDLYRLVVVLAATGTRFSQAARLLVGDVQIDRRRLLVPFSRKGKGKSGGHTPVPVTADVIDALLPAITGRPPDARLLEWTRDKRVPGGWGRAERGPWYSSASFDHAWAAIREHAKMNKVIPYALRHSSIVRMLRSNIPIRLTASLHDTSVKMVELHYSRFIVDSLEDLAAAALVKLLPAPDEGRVVRLRRK
jgi:integrase